MTHTAAYILGFTIWAGPIVGFGPQNIYVLEQGMRSRGWMVAAVCALCDMALGALGVRVIADIADKSGFGFGPYLALGALPLLLYGIQALRSAYAGRPESTTGSFSAGLNPILGALAFSLLNPYVYLDIIVILGGVSASVPAAERPALFAGAMTVSVLWFFGLAAFGSWFFGAFPSQRVYRLVEAVLAILCLSAAIQLAARAI